MPDVTMQTALTGAATTTGIMVVGNESSRFLVALVTALDTLLAEWDGARMASDFSVRDQQVPAGQARFQVQGFNLPQTTIQDSNATFYPAMTVRVLVHYHLTATEAEVDWTGYGMQSAFQELMDPQWWRDVGAFYVDVEPIGSGVQRVGNVVSFTVTASLTIAPAGE